MGLEAYLVFTASFFGAGLEAYLCFTASFCGAGLEAYASRIADLINPRRACAARVTVVGSVGLCVCVSVCLLSHISPMERLFVLKTRSRTQRATKVKKFVGFSLKPLRCRDPALPPLYGHAYSRPFFSCTRMRISRVYMRMIHRRGFSTLVLFIATVFKALYLRIFCLFGADLDSYASLSDSFLASALHL